MDPTSPRVGHESMGPRGLPTDSQTIERVREKLESRLGEPNERGCREWQGARDGDGYGRIRVSSQLVARTSQVRVWLDTGTWPAEACHHCDNPPCCESTHLYAGDRSTNMQDRARRGRQAGGRTGGSKTESDQIMEILKRVKGTK